MRQLAAAIAALSLGFGCSTKPPVTTKAPPPSPDWPMYGHDLHHSFTAQASTITSANVATLAPAWSFPVGDAVSASPTVVAGVVYIGGWDGFFYALDAATGAVNWKFQVDCDNAILPIPPQCLAAGQTEPDRSGTDGGLIVSSATVVGGQVYFAAGRTVYVLNAASGALVWKTVICGNPDDPACLSDTADTTLIFSSPLVYANEVIVGHTVDGTTGYRGGIVALDQATGAVLWSFEVDPVLDSTGNPVLGASGLPLGGQNRGCGSVWSSGAVDDEHSVVFFGTGDCQNASTPPYHESILALDAATGKLQWSYHQTDPNGCDADIGTSANVVDLPSGRFVGEGSKSGTYYLLGSQSGQLLWSKNVVFGGAAGGFIGTLAFDGQHLFGGTAIGDFGGPLCDPSNPADQAVEDPSFWALDPATGNVLWHASQAYTFGASTVVGDVVLNGVGNLLPAALRAYDASTGSQLASFTAAGAVNSGVTVVGDSVFFGSGNSADGTGGAVVALALP